MSYAEYLHTESVQDLPEFSQNLHISSTGAQEALDFIRVHGRKKSYELEMVQPLLKKATKEVDEYRQELITAAKEAEAKKIAEIKAKKDHLKSTQIYYQNEVAPAFDEFIKIIETFTYEVAGWKNSRYGQILREMQESFEKDLKLKDQPLSQKRVLTTEEIKKRDERDSERRKEFMTQGANSNHY